MAQGKAENTCGAKRRSGGECSKPAGWGTDHTGTGYCKLHGGCTPNHVKNAHKVQAEAAVETYGLAREIDPHSALIEELHRTAGHVAWLQSVIQELEGGELTRLMVQEEYGHGRSGKMEVVSEQASVWLDLYDRERKHFASVAKTCIAVGIEERRVQIAEQQGELMAQVIRGLLNDLGVPLTPEVQAHVRNNLTLIQGGKAA